MKGDLPLGCLKMSELHVFDQTWGARLALGLQGAKGSSSQGFTMALLLPASFMKK